MAILENLFGKKTQDTKDKVVSKQVDADVIDSLKYVDNLCNNSMNIQKSKLEEEKRLLKSIELLDQFKKYDDIDEKELVTYDIIALMDENYKDTYGGVSVEIQFGTTYNTEKAMVVLAGFEIEDAREQPYMDWYVLRTEAIQTTPDQNLTDMVRIGLKQLNLPWMEEEPMMLVVISQELEPQQ